MKYLQYERLEIVSNYLSSFSPSDYQIQGRVEAFSCKDTVEDKKLRRFVEARYSLAAGGAQALYSDQRIARKYFFYLLATLNAVFPDYDYSNLGSDAFVMLPGSKVAMELIDSAILLHRATSCSSDIISENVWSCIDEVVSISECDIYKFNPDTDTEPDSDGLNILWSYYLLFFNKKLKRIVFFMTRALCPTSKIYGVLHDSETDTSLVAVE